MRGRRLIAGGGGRAVVLVSHFLLIVHLQRYYHLPLTHPSTDQPTKPPHQTRPTLPTNSKSVLSYMMEARMQLGDAGALDDLKALRTQCIGLLMAGVDTSGSGFTNTLCVLSQVRGPHLLGWLGGWVVRVSVCWS